MRILVSLALTCISCLASESGFQLEDFSSLKFLKAKEPKTAEVDKVEGMFGLKLVQYFDVSRASRIGKSLEGGVVYIFTPTNKPPEVASCEVQITPKTRRIYSLVIQGRNDSARDQAFKTSLRKGLEARFGPLTTELTAFGLCDYVLQGPRLVAYFPNFTPTGGFALQFLHTTLQELGDVETKDLAIEEELAHKPTGKVRGE